MVDDALSSTTLALRLLAAVRLEHSKPGSVSPDLIEALTELIRARVTPEKSIGILPWLLMCDSPQPGTRVDDNDSNDAVDHKKFKRLLDALISNQIGHSASLVAPQAPVADLNGGFVVGKSGRTTATASSLRPLLALAIFRNIELSLGETPSPSIEESYRLGLRFLRQLQIDESLARRGPRAQR